LLAHANNYGAIFIEGLWQYQSFLAWRAPKQLGKPNYIFTHGMLGPWFKKAYPLEYIKK
jgi:hypothetical protein